MGDLNKLDQLVRQSLLRWPSLFGTRWDVLRHLYLVIGNGFEWRGGELVSAFDEDEPSEDQCRSEFFRDLDKLAAQFGADPLAHARRQFQLDHIDLLVHERRMDAGRRIGFDDVALISLTYSKAFCVPADVEASFKAGAVEVLRELVPGLHYLEQCGQDRGVRAAAGRELQRLDPVDHEAMQRLLSELLADDVADVGPQEAAS